MIIDQEIVALRGNPTQQRRLRDAMERAKSEWRDIPEVAAVRRNLAEYARGQPLECLSALAELMTSHPKARDFVDRWFETFSGALRRNPLAQIPMHHHHVEGFTTIRMAGATGVALSLSVYAARPSDVPTNSVVFADREMHDLAIRGVGEVASHRLRNCGTNVAIHTKKLEVTAGTKLSCAGNRQTRQYRPVTGGLTVLQLSRAPQEPKLTREFELETGRLLLQSSGDKLASQREMAMAVLSVMGRIDAAPVAAHIAETGGADNLRWEAVRHALALDSGIGMRTLSRIAISEDDPLHTPASQLLGQLREAYPQLAN